MEYWKISISIKLIIRNIRNSEYDIYIYVVSKLEDGCNNIL